MSPLLRTTYLEKGFMTMRIPVRHIGMAKPRFPWSLWRLTGADENLFDLSPEELEIFKALAEEASK